MGRLICREIRQITSNEGPAIGALDAVWLSWPERAAAVAREHALLLAAQGAKVVVNDLRGGPDGAERLIRQAIDLINVSTPAARTRLTLATASPVPAVTGRRRRQAG